jgi:hypothetical protein
MLTEANFIRTLRGAWDQRSSFKETTQATLIAVGKGGLPPPSFPFTQCRWYRTLSGGKPPFPTATSELELFQWSMRADDWHVALFG